MKRKLDLLEGKKKLMESQETPVEISYKGGYHSIGYTSDNGQQHSFNIVDRNPFAQTYDSGNPKASYVIARNRISTTDGILVKGDIISYPGAKKSDAVKAAQLITDILSRGVAEDIRDLFAKNSSIRKVAKVRFYNDADGRIYE